MDTALWVIAGLVAVGYVVEQVRSFANRRGAWCIAAALPLIGVGFVVARIIVDTRRDASSHNLWPFEVLGTAVVALVALRLLGFVERRREVGVDKERP